MDNARPTRATTRDTLGLIADRLAWLDRRQQVLAQNIANADTPGYRPNDLSNFAQALAARPGLAGLARTSPAHLPGAGRPGDVRPDRAAAERTPDGNAVRLDQQALRVAETDGAHAVAIALHRRYLALFRTALGRT